jgi:hypothetical protein
VHHPVYREKFAENLKRELPRIPLIGAVIPRSEATRNLAVKNQSEIPRSARDDRNGAEASPNQNDDAGPDEGAVALKNKPPPPAKQSAMW